jgi:hypothetical protein
VALSLGLIPGELKIVSIAQGRPHDGRRPRHVRQARSSVSNRLIVTFGIGLALGFALERGVLRWVYDKGLHRLACG